MSDVREVLVRHGWFHTGLVLLIVLLGNHLSSVAFVRADLTVEQRHTLSEVARDSVRGLRKPLLARVYFSEGLEPPYHDHRGALLDKLAELAVHADGGLEISATDPTGSPDRIEEAERFGVRALPYSFRSWDRAEARTVWMGVSFVYGDRHVAVDALPSLDTMEAELVRAIRRVTTDPQDTRRVGWLLGHGEPDPTLAAPNSPLAELWAALGASGHARTVAPRDEPIPDDLQALVVAAPERALAPSELVHLDQYVMRGGAILMWVSNTRPDFSSDRLEPVAHGLDGWLQHHGVTVERRSLLDREHTEQMVVPLEVGRAEPRLVRVNYPLALTTTDLARTERPVREIPRLLLPFASPIDLLPPSDELDRRVWARTMSTAVSVPDLPSLEPRTLQQEVHGETPGAWPVVVALSGTFTSYWEGRTAPVHEEAGELQLRSRPTRMVVVGSGDALLNNPTLALNAIDWMVEDPALIEVRGRGEAVAALLAPPRAEAFRAKVLVTALPLLLIAVVASAMVLLGRRR